MNSRPTHRRHRPEGRSAAASPRAGAHCGSRRSSLRRGFASQLAGRGRRAEKMDPSVSRSAVKTSDSPPPTDNTEQSSPMPSESVVGKRGEKGFYAVDESEFGHGRVVLWRKVTDFFGEFDYLFVRESPAWGVRLMNETMKILILNGPNLNLQGRRDTGVYGSQTFESYFEALKANYPSVEFGYFQSNIEGDRRPCSRPTAFTTAWCSMPADIRITSVALTRPCRFPSSRCTYSISPARSSATPAAGSRGRGSIIGFGLNSYRLGVYALLAGAEKIVASGREARQRRSSPLRGGVRGGQTLCQRHRRRHRPRAYRRITKRKNIALMYRMKKTKIVATMSVSAAPKSS